MDIGRGNFSKVKLATHTLLNGKLVMVKSSCQRDVWYVCLQLGCIVNDFISEGQEVSLWITVHPLIPGKNECVSFC